MMDRAAESRVGRRAFAGGPAVIGAGESFVDLFPGVSPTSLIKIRPVPGWMAKVNGLRRPIAQIARYLPWAVR